MSAAINYLARPKSWTPGAQVGVAIVPAAIFLGFAATSRTVAAGVAFAAVALVMAVGIQHRWGVAMCLAPVFLLPVTVMTKLPATGSLQWRFILAVASAVLATAYWSQGAGKPRLNHWTLGSAAFLFIALLVLGQQTHTSLQESASLPLFAYSGLVVGQCLRTPAAIRAIAVLAAPLAVLAILEAVGFEHVWSTVLHANVYTALSEETDATRSTASFGHPLIAGACLMAIGLLLLSARERLATLAALVCILAAVTTVSRSALLGGALGLTLFAMQAPGNRLRRLALFIVLALAVAATVSFVPSLRHSVERRVTGVNQGQLARDESVRTNSLSILKEELNVDPNRLLIGGGVGYSIKLLTARGGNTAGYNIFDNEYITMMYDGGLFVVLITSALLLVAMATSSKTARRSGLPAIAALAVVMYFVDGMEWPSLSVVTWMAIGYFTVPWQATAVRSQHKVVFRPSLPKTDLSGA